jgi:hypothetical protein
VRAVAPRLLLPVTLLLATVLALLSPRVVPYDMDEFAAYHPLGCAAFPVSRVENRFRERCGEYDLTLPLVGARLPLRSYLYIGSLPVVPYWPFWRFFRDPVSARVQGAFFWVGSLLLLARLLRNSLPGVLLPAHLFPFLPAAVLVDTGPVGLSLLLLLSALLVLRGAVLSPDRGALLGGLGGLLLFLGLFAKLVFAFCLPGVALLVLFWARGPRARAGLRTAVSAAAVFLPLALLLLLARTEDGARYVEVVSRARLVADPSEAGGVALGLGAYLLRANLVLPRIFTIPGSPLDVLPALALLGILVLGRRDPEVGAYTLAGALTFLATNVSTRASEAHHAAFFALFLVAAAGQALRGAGRAATLAAAGSLLLVWGSLALRLPGAEVDPRRNFEKDALLATIRREDLEEKTLVLHASWGTYYIAHLFGGKGNAELFSKKFLDDPELLGEVKARATALGRGILLVTRKAERLEEADRVLGPRLHSIEEGAWWGVEYLR